jgi:hypothetical protein
MLFVERIALSIIILPLHVLIVEALPALFAISDIRSGTVLAWQADAVACPTPFVGRRLRQCGCACGDRSWNVSPTSTAILPVVRQTLHFVIIPVMVFVHGTAISIAIKFGLAVVVIVALPAA